jgi:hypothetical protein
MTLGQLRDGKASCFKMVLLLTIFISGNHVTFESNYMPQNNTCILFRYRTLQLKVGCNKIEIMVYVKLFNFNLNIKLLIAGNYSFLHLYF